MIKLNPCPACGNEPDIFERNSLETSFQASCSECGDDTLVISRSASGAINAWNTATSEQPVKTLRDEFALAAMSGMLQIEGLTYQEIASGVYQLADATIKERNK